ncbi:hypothetical protein FOZ62_022126 [Perkinsus olseni]|uniref:Peptidase A1 domain-containing protein n=2 Tax=Perkinsus olseni TaxID=32597 RepID=A0A7J6QP17_PEROL|nr:hypothetical protein FOZ62_022126 [Perkinsus olseni]
MAKPACCVLNQSVSPHYALLGDILVDGQRMHALIDTGSSALYFTWRDWYERFTFKGACDWLETGCYVCSTPCGSDPVTRISHADQTAVSISPRGGKLRLGSTDVDSIAFGLVVAQDPLPDLIPPVNSIGLGIIPTSNYQSLMDQLRGRLGSTTFAIYLKSNPSGRPLGEVILGGGDPGKYVPPLRYVQLRSQQEYLVTIGTYQVGSGRKTIGINQDALIDTGTQGLIVPQFYVRGLLKDITGQASDAVGGGRRVECTEIPGLSLCVFPCQHRSYFPPIEIGLSPYGDVPITISSSYYTRNLGGICSLAITAAPPTLDRPRWTLPDFLLVDKYFEFQPSQGRIGIANLRSR